MDRSAIRILHAAPGTPSLDFYLDTKIVVQDLNYEELTNYLDVAPGEYNIKVFMTGETAGPVINLDLSITSGELTTVTVTGVFPDIGLLSAVQTVQCPVSQQALLRTVNLSPDAPRVDVMLGENNSLFTGVEYQEVTDYQRVKGGTYYLQVGPSGIGNTVLHAPGLDIKPGQVYTIYLMGRLEGQPDLKARLITDSTEHCVQEVASPPVPDAKPYQWKRAELKVFYR